MSSFSNSRATNERIPIMIIYIIGLLVKLIEQARVDFVRPRCYSNVALKPVVRSFLSFFLLFLLSLLANLNISH